MGYKKRKQSKMMKRVVNSFLLMIVLFSLMGTACGSEADSDHDLDRNLVESDMDNWRGEEKETQYLEVETIYVTEDESIAEEVATEELPTEEPMTEEPTTAAPVVQSVDATVGGEHYIGDELSAADFKVVVTMSDGSSMTNPAGWAADCLHLGDAENYITVTYQGIATEIVVYATERSIEALTEAPTEASNQSKEMDYILNKNSDVFHYPGCKSVKRMKESNKIYFTGTREEVIGKGYRPCQNCNP